MRDAAMKNLWAALLLAAVAGCAADRPADGFDTFWNEFSAAVAANRADDVARLTEFPFLLDGVERSRSEFQDVWDALFDEATRECIAEALPQTEADGSRSVACGMTILVFTSTHGPWRFSEFAADPEAAADDGFSDDAIR